MNYLLMVFQAIGAFVSAVIVVSFLYATWEFIYHAVRSSRPRSPHLRLVGSKRQVRAFIREKRGA